MTFNLGELQSPPKFLKDIVKEIDGYVDSYFVKIEPFIWCEEFNCHNNCLEYISTREGKMLNGYYVRLDLSCGVYRFIDNTKKIDITPFKGDRIFFIETDKNIDELEIELVFDNGIRNKILNKPLYYVYGLYEKNNPYPFYIGKGKNNRMYYHLNEKNLLIDTNYHKVNKIYSIGIENIKPIKIYNNLIDEKTSYDLEEILINKYKNSLTNICESASPPNHKGKSYFDIYGPIQGYIQKLRRGKHQKSVGGYGPKSFTKKNGKNSKGPNNSNFSGLTENDILKIGKEFCEFFNYKVSRQKWKWFIKENNISLKMNKSSFRFNGEDYFKVILLKYKPVVEKNQQGMWFHNIFTKETIRLQKWKLEMGIEKIPKDFIEGRK